MIDAIDDVDLLDDSPLVKGATPTRTCIVTREKGSPFEMIRFAVSPDNIVTPDLARKLPGRGAWVMMSKTTLEMAVKKNAFSRAFKRQVNTPEGLVLQVETLMRDFALKNLSLALKAGLASFGFDQVAKAMKNPQTRVLIAGIDASEDQLAKLIAGTAIKSSEINQIANEPLQFSQRSLKGTDKQTLLWVRSFTSNELDTISGRSGLTYMALKRGEGLNPFLNRMTDLACFSLSKSTEKLMDNA